MKYWIYCEPASNTCMEPVYTILSDAAILAQYWDYWQEKMTNIGKIKEISYDNCIKDWVSVHWAVEAIPSNLLRIIDETVPDGQ